MTSPNPRRHGWRSTSLVIVGTAALVMGGASVALAQDEQPFVTDGQAEGEVVVATAGGTFQEALEDAFYGGFTDATGITVTPVTINPQEQWAKVKADTEAGNVQWDIVNVGPDSLVLQQDYLADLGAGLRRDPEHGDECR